MVASGFKKWTVQHLRVSGVTTAHFGSLNKFRGQVFRSMARHTFKGHRGFAQGAN